MLVLEYSEEFAHMKSPKNIQHCKICPYFTSSTFLMVNHVRRQHTEFIPFNCISSSVETYYCKNCDFHTELALHFKQHLKTRHGSRSENKDLLNEEYNTRSYICKKCSYETHFLLNWLQHATNCLRNNEEKCEATISANTEKKVCKWNNMCELKQKQKYCFKKQEILRDLNEDEIVWHHKLFVLRHVSAKHSGKWYECNKCPYRDQRETYLRSYVNSRHVDKQDIKWYECAKCPFKTKCTSGLKKHNIRHLDEKDIKWYECSKCSFKAKRNSDLKRHVNTRHLDDKDAKWYECAKCPFKTKRNFALTRHINTRHVHKHKQKCSSKKQASKDSNEDQIRWHYCADSSYKLKIKQYVHLKGQHSNNWYNCTYKRSK